MKPSSLRSLLLALLTLCLLLEIGCGAPEKSPSPAANPPDSTATDKKKNSSNWDFGNQDTLTLFHTLDPLPIMGRLFDQPKYDSLGYALWRPNFNERLQFNVSADGLCHTRIDTLMLWKDRDQRQCAVLVFSTEHFGYSTANHDSMEITDCRGQGNIGSTECLRPIRLTTLSGYGKSSRKMPAMEGTTQHLPRSDKLLTRH